MINNNKFIINLHTLNNDMFYLLHMAESICKTLNFSQEKTNTILDEMQRTNNNNLVNIFKLYFSDYVLFI